MKHTMRDMMECLEKARCIGVEYGYLDKNSEYELSRIINRLCKQRNRL
jgi:hypothetical protein